ncbi:MAG: family 16 glycosylhydrolase [Propionibacteriaceae bacterium]|nr:family 16 glycosylhydrolase [Propionibacteriaceae bacterium]
MATSVGAQEAAAQTLPADTGLITGSYASAAIRLDSSKNFLSVDPQGRAIQSSTPAQFQITTHEGFSQLRHLTTGRCLSSGGTADFSRPVLADCQTTAAQQWRIGTRIAARDSGRLLEALGNRMGAGEPVIIYQGHEGRHQLWQVLSNDADSVDVGFQSSSGHYLSLDTAGAAVHSHAMRRFDLATVGGFRMLHDRTTGRCLASGAWAEARPRLADCRVNDSEQHWYLTGTELTARNSWRSIRTRGSESGAAVSLAYADGSPSERWTLVKHDWHAGSLDRAGSGDGNWGMNQMPTSSSPGFRHVWGEDFLVDAPAGRVAADRFGRPANAPYSHSILAYDHWPALGGEYRFQDNVSVSGGTLKSQVRYDPATDTRTGAQWAFHNNGQFDYVYGAVEQRVRFLGHAPSYGVASLMWPVDPDGQDNWGRGELDFPEGNFEESPLGYHHCLHELAAHNCSTFDTRVRWSDWHVYRIEWTDTGSSYYIDGRLLGTDTIALAYGPHRSITQLTVVVQPPDPDDPKYANDRPWYEWDLQRYLAREATMNDEHGTFEIDWIRYESCEGACR